MFLDALRDFAWENEPENVRFVENGLTIKTEPQTDFWQNVHHKIHKDNGHFFYTRKNGDFSLTLKWSFDTPPPSAQCGLMVRVDSLSWAKIGILTPDTRFWTVGSVATQRGMSDWAVWPLETKPQELWFRVARFGTDFLFFISTDGNNFRQVRLFNLFGVDTEIKVGAYACSPQDARFECVLEDIS